MRYGYARRSAHARQARIASGSNAALGIWLVFSPLLYQYPSDNLPAIWNSAIIGGLIAICGMLRVLSPREHAELSWTNLVLGGWTALSPWIFNYLEGGELWNSLLVGLAVVALAICSASATTADRRHLHA